MKKAKASKKKPAHPGPAIWLTLLPSDPKPKGPSLSVCSLDELWKRLESGACSSVMVDGRFKFMEGDAWEVALRVRERFPRVPLSVMHATANPNSKGGPAGTFHRHSF